MKMKYKVELDSNEGIFIGNLIMLNKQELRGKITPEEGVWREELYEKIHPANNNPINPKKSKKKIES